MARNVSREAFLAGRPPETGRSDADIEGYLQVARATLWRELRDQPLTMGGCCLSAAWAGRPQSEDPLPYPALQGCPAWSLGSWTGQVSCKCQPIVLPQPRGPTPPTPPNPQ